MVESGLKNTGSTTLLRNLHLPDGGICRNTFPEGGIEDERVDGLDYGLQEAARPLVVVAPLLQPRQHACTRSNQRHVRSKNMYCVLTLFHLPTLRFHSVGGCWDRTQDSDDYGTECQAL
jgi:hypothetical protein